MKPPHGTTIVDVGGPGESARDRDAPARRRALPHPQGPRRRRRDDHERGDEQPPSRCGAARSASRTPRRGSPARSAARRPGRSSRRNSRVKPRRRRLIRRVRARRLRRRRLQGLGHLGQVAAAPAAPREDLRLRRAPLRHGRALRLHLDRDGRLCRQHPRDLRPRATREAGGGVALVDARTAHRRRRDSRPGPAAATGCTTRCASATRCGRAAGMRGLRVIDVRDIAQPRTIGAYDYHPPFPEPTHTVMPLPFKVGGREHRGGVRRGGPRPQCPERQRGAAGRMCAVDLRRERPGATSSRCRCST